MSHPKLVTIVGETASGKSSLALKVAAQFSGEIISADSWQVYRGFDVGTAKPSPVEQSKIKHHLIDIRLPTQGFSAAVYKDLAITAINMVASAGKLPIMVGGTGLYIDSVLYNYSFLPAGTSKQRAQLQALNVDELLGMLDNTGIDTSGIDTRNKRRLIRLIESAGKQPSRSKMRDNTLVMGLKLPRTILRSNIESRVEEMFRNGLKREVEELMDRYGWEIEPMKGVGYRQFRDYFLGEQSLAQTKRKIVKATLELAKRQRTWFKRHPEIIWVADHDQALQIVAKFISGQAYV